MDANSTKNDGPFAENFINNSVSRTAHTAAIAALETAINTALKYDPATKNQLAALNDHVFLLHCTSPKLPLYIIPAEEVRLCSFYQGDITTTLKGSMKDFVKLATANDPASLLINSDLELHGDSQALITLQNIAQQIDIDWEAPLTNIFGDVLGHQLSKSLRASFNFGAQVIKSVKRQVDDYIKEESELAPAQWQVDKFYRQVEDVSQRVERLHARINKLTATTPSNHQP